MNINHLTEVEETSIPDIIKDLTKRITKVNDPYYMRCKIIAEFLQNVLKENSFHSDHSVKSKKVKKTYAYRAFN